MANLPKTPIVDLSEKLEKGDICTIIDADKAKSNIGTDVHLIQFIPCYWDGKSRVETEFYSFDNNTDNAAWIVSHTVPHCELEYVTDKGELDFGHLALIKCSHLKLVSKASPTPERPPKPVIQCG